MSAATSTGTTTSINVSGALFCSEASLPAVGSTTASLKKYICYTHIQDSFTIDTIYRIFDGTNVIDQYRSKLFSRTTYTHVTRENLFQHHRRLFGETLVR